MHYRESEAGAVSSRGLRLLISVGKEVPAEISSLNRKELPCSAARFHYKA
jgi:hypothetical protein